MLRHKHWRLSWTVSMYNQRRPRFFDHYNTCHSDEKWFFLIRDCTVCRVFPEYSVTDECIVQERVSMPTDPKIYHKTRILKVMFLAVTARLRPEYGFDGKVGLLPFAVTNVARRSDRRTGTVTGVTQMLQTVNVDAVEYRKVMLQNVGAFDMIRKKIWWFGR